MTITEAAMVIADVPQPTPPEEVTTAKPTGEAPKPTTFDKLPTSTGSVFATGASYQATALELESAFEVANGANVTVKLKTPAALTAEAAGLLVKIETAGTFNLSFAVATTKLPAGHGFDSGKGYSVFEWDAATSTWKEHLQHCMECCGSDRRNLLHSDGCLQCLRGADCRKQHHKLYLGRKRRYHEGDGSLFGHGCKIRNISDSRSLAVVAGEREESEEPKIMKQITRAICILLTLLCSVWCFAACRKTPETEQPGTSGSSVTTDSAESSNVDENGYEKDSIPANTNFGDYTFNILSWAENNDYLFPLGGKRKGYHFLRYLHAEPRNRGNLPLHAEAGCCQRKLVQSGNLPFESENGRGAGV